jgi:pimeloyl-ACP methyl ester carboxylesterase
MQYHHAHKLPIVAVALLSLLTAGAPVSSKYEPRPYIVNVDSNFIEATRAKASTFHASLDIAQPAWTDGPPTSNITSLAKYWAEEYDWAEEQAQINANFSHFMTTIPPPGGGYNNSLDIHFIHQQSKRADAIPMLMLHGWPSTSLEWKNIIPGLVEPADDNKPAFHIVAPDLPGYGFSPAPTAPGLGAAEQSATFASLMQQLGYERYALYSTDLGYVIALEMVVDFERRIINHVSDFFIVFPDDADMARFAANQTTPEENAYIASVIAYNTNYSAYAEVHSTLPLSIAHALDDSPVGFLAWMYQLVFAVSDQAYTASELITDAMLLYIPGVYGNIRSYKELYSVANFAPKSNSTVPTSVLQFGDMGSYTALKNFNYVVSRLSFLFFSSRLLSSAD